MAADLQGPARVLARLLRQLVVVADEFTPVPPLRHLRVLRRALVGISQQAGPDRGDIADREGSGANLRSARMTGVAQHA
jgi:hypothetical protein